MTVAFSDLLTSLAFTGNGIQLLMVRPRRGIWEANPGSGTHLPKSALIVSYPTDRPASTVAVWRPQKRLRLRQCPMCPRHRLVLRSRIAYSVSADSACAR